MKSFNRQPTVPRRSMKLSLCLDMLFRDQPFPERMKAAADHGYPAFEFWDWRDKPIEAVAETARALGITAAAMSGNRRHALIDLGAREGLVREMRHVLEIAGKLSCRNIMMLSDVLAADGSAVEPPPATAKQKIESMVEGLRALASAAETADVTLLLEPLNTRLDHRGCFLDSSALAVDVVRQVESPRVKVLYDVYHMHMMGEDVLKEIETHFAAIGYIHIADSPGRHQPGTGKIDFAALAELLNRKQYDGFLGMEFAPLGPSNEAVRTPLLLFGRFVNA